MIYWSASMTYVSFVVKICMMDVSATGFYLLSGMMSFCVQMIYSAVYVECHSKVNG